MKFLLFDIDGTLLDSGGAGTKAMNSAFSVPVSTGPYPYKTLAKSDADMVLYNLPDYNFTELMEEKKWLS